MLEAAEKSRIEYQLQPEFTRLTVRTSINSRQFRDVFERLFNDRAYRKRRNVVIDQRGSASAFNTADAKESAQMMSRYANKLGPKMAMLVRTGAQFGMARMFGSFVQRFGVTVRPFYTEEDAVEWLAATENSDVS